MFLTEEILLWFVKLQCITNFSAATWLYFMVWIYRNEAVFGI